MNCHRHLLVLLVSAFIICSANTVEATTPFANEFVDVNGRTATYPSLAIDANGNPSIACRGQSGTLTYAHKEAGSWSFEFPDQTILNVNSVSLALDADGNPHIIFLDGSTLRYARRIAGIWTFETVDTGPSMGLYPSLKLDAAGNARVAYYDGTNFDLRYAARNSGVWTPETVASAGTVGENCSLALDDQGYPRISYFDGTNQDLRYAYKTTGSWTTELVDGVGFVGQYTSLALDDHNAPRISYFDATNSRVKYASKATGAWVLETINAPAVQFTSIAVDAQGSPDVVFYDGVLRFASRASGSWVVEAGDPITPTGYYPSLALDAQGNARVAYVDVTLNVVKYADAAVHLLSPRGGELWNGGSVQTVRWTGGGTVDVQFSDDGGASYTTLASGQTTGSAAVTVPDWSSQRVRVRVLRASPLSSDATPGLLSVGNLIASPWWSIDAEPISPGASQAALALDADGTPHLAISTYHSYRSGHGWASESVDYQMGYPAIQIGSDGTPYIAYYHVVEHTLKFAYRSGGIWSTTVVDNGNFRDISMAWQPNGNLAIAYYDVTNGDLKYASGGPGFFTVETVDGTGGVNVGEFASLAVLGRSITGYGFNAGTPVIAYFDRTNGNVKLATKGTSSWTIEVVDSPGDVGYYASLALDRNGYPVVAYMDNTIGRVRLARKGVSGWSLETVQPSIGYNVHLALDAEDNPHVIYSDAFASRMKIATKRWGTWFYETIAPLSGTSTAGSPYAFLLDAYGNGRMTWYDGVRQRMLYGSSALEIGEPRIGDIWTVGASHTVTWNGSGPADLSLSLDGGATWNAIASGVVGGAYAVIVPHTPSRFCRFRVERSMPHSVSATSGLFTIESNISLLSIAAERTQPGPGGSGSVRLTWSTRPGVGAQGIAGYRLYRLSDMEPDPGRRIGGDLITDTSYVDDGGSAARGYRLATVNHLMEESELGRVEMTPISGLALSPLPYRGGTLSVTFVAPGGTGSQSRVELLVHDVAGRTVRTLVRGSFAAGTHGTAWDGRDDHGNALPDGVYLFEARSGGQRSVAKCVVIH